MTHKVHPYSHRLGIIRDWKSRWFATEEKYKDFLKSDVLLREYLETRLKGMYVSSIEMERSNKTLRLVLKSSRPGMIIGRSGEGMLKLKEDIKRFIHQKNIAGAEDIKIDVEEIRSPESDAAIVSQMVIEGLEKRMPFRRVLKQTVDKVMANRDVKGVKIALAGRVGGSEMSRNEHLKKGRIPLQTFRADIDYARGQALLPTYGYVGVKVWIYKGEIFEDKTKVAAR
jgi:small subunit ribosomal protein S3